MEENNNENQITTNFEKFDVLYLLLTKRKFLMIFLIIFFVIGIFFALIIPKTYNASVIIIPQISGSSGSTKKYSKIAALVGLNLDSESPTNIYPNLYPLILSSKPFQRELLQTSVTLRGQEGTATLAEYITKVNKPSFVDIVKKYTIGLPALLIDKLDNEKIDSGGMLLDSAIVRISSEEKRQMDYLEDNISLTYDEIEGVVEIVGSMPEPIISAVVVQNTHKILQQYIINYSIEKSKDQLDYISKRLKDSEKIFFEKRTALSRFDEQNLNINSAFVTNKRDQLKFDFDLIYSLYSNLSEQYEAAKLQVKRDTPIFTIVKPVVVPRKEASPNKLAVILGSMVFGLFLGMILILYKYFIHFLKDFMNKREVSQKES